MDAAVFEVRVNRLLLLAMCLFGGLFLLAGLDGLVFHRVFGPDLSFWAKAGFVVFFVLLGGVVAVNCAWYLLKPPVMLRFTPQGVSFGLGLRYRHGEPFPWRLLERAALGADLSSLTSLRQLLAGPQLTFAQSPDIPGSLVTSAGVSYIFNTLTLSTLYMNRLPGTVVREAERCKKAYA